MVALRDYDPFHSGTFGRPPQDQLSLKKGDIVTAYGDMDVNGFYRVDMNGEYVYISTSDQKLISPYKTATKWRMHFVSMA